MVDAPEFGDEQAVVEDVEEGDEGLARDRPGGAPFALADRLARHRIDEDFVVADLVEIAGGGIEARLDAEDHRMARLGVQRHIGEIGERVFRRDAFGELERRDEGAAALHVHEMRVQELVELVIPGDHRAGQPGDEQEGGDRQADETMREDEGLPHPVHQR